MGDTTLDRTEIVDFLGATAFFGHLAADVLDDLAGRLAVVALEGGDTLVHEGDPADGLHLVVAGRLEARTGTDDDLTALGEIGRGEVVGEAALLTDLPRTATVVALRDSLLLHLPVAAFEEIVARHPEVLRAIAGQVVDRLRRAGTGAPAAQPARTIAALVLHPGERARRFVDALAETLGGLEPSLAVVHRGDAPSGRSVTAWTSQLEADHELVLYRSDAPTTGPADEAVDEWARRCLRQADVVVVVADATRSPGLTAVDEVLAAHRRRVPSHVELVLVHPPAREVPSGTATWLARRDVRRHHHVRADAAADVGRVARLVIDRGIGLCLSGGGARGMAELGVVRAMGELGIPIDAIGGTSAGSLVAAAVARGWPIDGVTQVLRRGMVEQSNPVDVTIPLASLASGRRIVERLKGAAGEVDVEDLWIDYFSVSTNLSRLGPEVHRTGRAWLAVRASMSIPGVFPPVPHGDDVLVDGGLVDNLPVAELRSRHDGLTVVAVDVGSHRGLAAGDLPASTILPGWRLLVDRLDPRRPSPEVVGVVSLLTRLTELGGGSAGADRGDVLVRPDVEAFPILDFANFDQLVEVGHRAGREVLEPWWAEQAAPTGPGARPGPAR